MIACWFEVALGLFAREAACCVGWGCWRGFGRCIGMATVDAGEVAEWIEDVRVWLIPRNGRVRCLRCAAESTSVGGLPIARCPKVVSLEPSRFLDILAIEVYPSSAGV